MWLRGEFRFIQSLNSKYGQNIQQYVNIIFYTNNRNESGNLQRTWTKQNSAEKRKDAFKHIILVNFSFFS